MDEVENRPAINFSNLCNLPTTTPPYKRPFPNIGSRAHTYEWLVIFYIKTQRLLQQPIIVYLYVHYKYIFVINLFPTNALLMLFYLPFASNELWYLFLFLGLISAVLVYERNKAQCSTCSTSDSWCLWHCLTALQIPYSVLFAERFQLWANCHNFYGDIFRR